MKKTMILSVMAVLWPFMDKDKRARNKDKGTKLKALLLLALLYFIMGSLHAQENKAVDVTLKGIQIGQRVPDITITNLHNYKDANGKPATTAKISDFKGKLLILDFWATWCSPCVAMIPRMDSLQREFGDKIQFLSVTYQSEKEVLPFLEKFEKQQGRKFNLPVVTAEQQLHQLFPHVSLPHYVWVDSEGLVNAITGYKEVNHAAIMKMLEGKLALVQKKDVTLAYQKNKPLLLSNISVGEKELIYHTLLTKYVEGLASGYSIHKSNGDGTSKMTFRNVSLARLYQMAYGKGMDWFGKNKTILKVSDTTKFWSTASGQDYVQWLKGGNGYCYELIVPISLTDQLYLMMQGDLDKLFPQYVSRVESQLTKCLVLVRTSNLDKIAAVGKQSNFVSNAFGIKMSSYGLGRMVSELNIFYMAQSKMPIINGTGYEQLVDIDIKANLSNIEELNAALASYDLALVEQDRTIDVLVIKDCVFTNKS